MLYTLMGLVFATFFGIAAFTVYGHEGLLANPWVQYVFWWLIGTGVLLAVVENLGSMRLRLGHWQPSWPSVDRAVPSH